MQGKGRYMEKITKSGGIKSYKLNKTLESSVYPLEIELKEINKNTLSSTINNLFAFVFSGIGTTILFQKGCVPKLLGLLYCRMGLTRGGGGEAFINMLVVVILFIFLSVIGRLISMWTMKKHELYEKKATSEGRLELEELFHKSIINDIVTGISFVDKAEELNYIGHVAEMYLYESVYYFKSAKIQMELMEVFSSEKDKNHDKFIDEVGDVTIKSTMQVYIDGLKKLRQHLPDGKEQKMVDDIIKCISPFL